MKPNPEPIEYKPRRTTSWVGMRQYRERDALLKKLGFASYVLYLASTHWQAIRFAVLNAKRECAGCTNPATQVHHEVYTIENLSGESTNGLIALCRDCHEYIEIGGRRTKLTPTQVAYRLCKQKRRKQEGKEPLRVKIAPTWATAGRRHQRG